MKLNLLWAVGIFAISSLSACTSVPPNEKQVSKYGDAIFEKPSLVYQGNNNNAYVRQSRMELDGRGHHYIHRHGAHLANDTMVWGERSGAHSYSYASGSHGEIPTPSSTGFYGSVTSSAYDQVHYLEDSGSLPGRASAYMGEDYLPPGTWTGHDAAPSEAVHVVTWREDAQGRIRSDEIAGAPMKVIMPSSAPAQHP